MVLVAVAAAVADDCVGDLSPRYQVAAVEVSAVLVAVAAAADDDADDGG